MSCEVEGIILRTSWHSHGRSFKLLNLVKLCIFLYTEWHFIVRNRVISSCNSCALNLSHFIITSTCRIVLAIILQRIEEKIYVFPQYILFFYFKFFPRLLISLFSHKKTIWSRVFSLFVFFDRYFFHNFFSEKKPINGRYVLMIYQFQDKISFVKLLKSLKWFKTMNKNSNRNKKST